MFHCVVYDSLAKTPLYTPTQAKSNRLTTQFEKEPPILKWLFGRPMLLEYLFNSLATTAYANKMTAGASLSALEFSGGVF